MKNICFLHVATVGKYQAVVNDIFAKLKTSGLLNELHRIYVNIAGDETVVIPPEEKIKIFPEKCDLGMYELSTLNLVKQYSDIKDANILYLHTKGVTSFNNPCIEEWREYMLYFNILKYKNAIKQLDTHDAVGVDLVDTPVKHFSGNIWWSKTSHIKTLPQVSDLPVVLSERHKCEFWICNNTAGTYKSLHNSDIDVYSRHLTRYPKENYENIN